MRLVLASGSIDDLLRQSLESTREHGDQIITTRGPVRELRGVTLELDNPRARVSRTSTVRHMFSALAETVWYFSGLRDHDLIRYYIRNYMNRVGNGSGAYGPRLFGEGGQIPRVIDQLRSKPTTRQAVVQLFDASDLEGDSKDVPCTCTLQFFVRDGRLDLVVYMRSNDLLLGLPHDVFAFTFIQELVACAIGSDLGTYVHMVGSLHYYLEDDEKALAYLNEGVQNIHAMPPMPLEDPLGNAAWLVRWEEALRLNTPPPSLGEASSYWVALGRLLSGFHAYRADNKSALKAIRDDLSSSFYGLYLSDRAFRLEGQIHDA